MRRPAKHFTIKPSNQIHQLWFSFLVIYQSQLFLATVHPSFLALRGLNCLKSGLLCWYNGSSLLWRIHGGHVTIKNTKQNLSVQSSRSRSLVVTLERRCRFGGNQLRFRRHRLAFFFVRKHRCRVETFNRSIVGRLPIRLKKKEITSNAGKSLADCKDESGGECLLRFCSWNCAFRKRLQVRVWIYA